MTTKVDLYILGSQSKDRKALVESARLIPCIVLPSEYKEHKKASAPENLAKLLATRKGDHVVPLLRSRLKDDEFFNAIPLDTGRDAWHVVLLAADTIVSFKSEVFGKAKEEFEAFATLSQLQGQVHKLITGYNVKHLLVEPSPRSVVVVDEVTGVTSTRVKFNPLTSEEIKGYIATGEWRGRAGCYAIQGVASQFIRAVEGSPTGVIGLPVSHVMDAIEGMGLAARPRA